VILPWDQMNIYDARLQLIERDFDVLTADGLRSTVNIAFRFRIDEKTVGVLHKYVGPDYLDVLLVPAVGAQARRIFALYSPEEAFTAKRAEIETLIHDAVDRDLLENFNPGAMKDVRFVVIEDVLIRSVQFPPSVAAAIERKSTEDNRAQEYDFTIAAERKEAERKEIEAQGIRRFQDIVKDGLTDNYLRWRGIEATLNLAQSQNSKVVIIGSGPNGLPIILGNMDDRAAPVPQGPMSTPAGPLFPPTAPLTPGGPRSVAPSLTGPRSDMLPRGSSSQNAANAVSPTGPPTAGPPSPVLGSATPPGPGASATPPAPDLRPNGNSPISTVTPSQP
jgi:prohibitin 1